LEEREMLDRSKLAISMLCLIALPTIGATSSAAQDFPTKPVQIIVPFAAGQSGDILARVLGESLGPIWGKTLVVDNKPGAGGTLGTQFASKADADGYTLLLASSGPIAIGPHLYPNAGYDPRRDFTPTMNVAGVAQALVVSAKSKYRTIEDLIKAAKAEPGKLNFASGGSGSTQHLTMELFKQRAGIDMTHIAYRGSGPAYPDLIAGRIDAMFDSSPAAASYVTSGQARVLAVSTAQRIPSMPDVPTVAESGLSGFDVLGWLGIVAPARLDPAIREKLHTDIKKAMDSPSTRSRLDTLGMIVIGGTPEDFAKFIEGEFSKWGEIIKASGVRVD
jgi:tripartite-type tricarboxylate transporter receptor subunit TctC